MVSKTATVKNEFGIHCRPSALIAQEARQYEGTVTVRVPNGEADAKSVLELVGLAVPCGEQVEITVQGADEEAVCNRFVSLFETCFDFER